MHSHYGHCNFKQKHPSGFPGGCKYRLRQVYQRARDLCAVFRGRPRLRRCASSIKSGSQIIPDSVTPMRSSLIHFLTVAGLRSMNTWASLRCTNTWLRVSGIMHAPRHRTATGTTHIRLPVASTHIRDSHRRRPHRGHRRVSAELCASCTTGTAPP